MEQQSESSIFTTTPNNNRSDVVATVNNDDSNDRIMNDTTMPPPKQVVLSSQKHQTGIASNTNTSTAMSISMPAPESAAVSAARVRKKVSRFGLSDWTRLLSVSKDLAQLKGQPIRNKISWKEIKKHNTVHDGWMVLKNKVYNISPYLPYHPGGEKILRGCLGRDGTVLFEKYHQWVNEERLIGKLYLGNLDRNTKYDDDSSDDDDGDDDNDNNNNNDDDK